MINASKRRGEFGKRIKALRTINSLTASDLARLTEVTPAAVWQWEKNGTEPRRPIIEKIAMHFNVPISELTGEQEVIESFAQTEAQNRLSDHSLEDLLKAIQAKGYRVSIFRKTF